MNIILNKKIKIIISTLAILAVAFLITYYNSYKKIKTVCFEQNCFGVEVVSDEPARQRGLMDRESLNKDRGMLFIFDNEDKHPFWMKNTKMTLDVIWIDKDYKIVDIQTLNPCITDPCPTFTPSNNAKYVLEINAGLAQKLNLKTGDRAELNSHY